MELLVYAITETGIAQLENTTFSALPDSSYIFYNGSLTSNQIVENIPQDRLQAHQPI